MTEHKPNLTLIDESSDAKQTVEGAVEKQTQPQQKHVVPIPPQAQRKALREFKEWKHQLADMIRKKSTIAWSVQGGKLVYHFVLPSDLVKLVWNTTIRERVKLEELKGAEGAVERAIDTLRKEVDGAVEQIVEKRRDAETEAVRRTLEHLANHPPFAAAQEDHASTSEPPAQEEAQAERKDAPVEEPAL